MAWNCTLYSNFKKRANSTLQPSGGTTFPCRIKHDTDFKNPTVEILAADLSDVNYMYLNGSYFYVTSCISHRTGVWEITGARDAMATFKNDIANVQSLVLYAQTGTDAGSVDRVPDERIPIRRSPYQNNVAQYIIGNFQADPTGGSFILSAVGESGGVITYILSQSAMAGLVAGLNTSLSNRLYNAFLLSSYPQDEVEAIWKALWGFREVFAQEIAYGNYADCIKSCYWIPFSGFYYGSASTIYLGDYNTGVVGYVYSDRVVNQSWTISLPWETTDWKRNNQMFQVYLPFCGTVALPTDKILNISDVLITVALDVIGGSLAYRVSAGGETIVVTGANVGAPYAIGSSNITLQQVMSGVSQAIGGGINAATGAIAAGATGGMAGLGGVVGGISSVASGIAQAITPQVQTVGSMGGVAAAGLLNYIRLESLYYEPIGEAAFRSAYGYPVMRVGSVGSGYNMCRGFSVECAGTQDEINLINSYFNNGAYYE